MRIAIIGNSTLIWLGQHLKRLLNEIRIDADFHITEYEQYVQAILNEESDLHRFAPEVAILAFHTETLIPELMDASWFLSHPNDRETRLLSLSEQILDWVERLRGRHNCAVLLHTLVPQLHPVLGIADSKNPLGAVEFIERVNLKLKSELRHFSDVHLIDQVRCMRLIGEEKAVDHKMRYLAGLEFSHPLMSQMAHAEARIIRALHVPPKKVLVLDLDNTLWKGTLVEDGTNSLQVGPAGVGRAYQDLQRWALALHDRGVLLCIASKNDEAEALNALESLPGCLLRQCHFAASLINWEDKAANIMAMADHLNLSLNAFVFLDDNPAERELILQTLPDVAVLDFPDDTAKLPLVLAASEIFDSLHITKDDKNRTTMYRTQVARNMARNQFTDLDSFLASLAMVVTISHARTNDIPRAGQLIRKTNQFNMTTIRRTDEELHRLIDNPNCSVYCVSLEDRFGDQGMVGVIITEGSGSDLFIDTFLLSCRVLERKIEHALIGEMVSNARKQGYSTLRARWCRTGKNERYRLAYESAGLEIEMDGEDSITFLKIIDSVEDGQGALPYIGIHWRKNDEFEVS